MKYDPRNPVHRATLGRAIESAMARAGFKRCEKTRAGEVVFCYPASPTVTVKVYSGCTGEPCNLVARPVGADAIRVCATIKQGDRERGYIKAKRVHRTGAMNAIIERTVERARATWTAARERASNEVARV